MAENSKIEWTDHTFNPWRGCAHKLLRDGTPHPGCEHCYAEAMSKRNPSTLGVWGNEGTRVLANLDQWRGVVRWNREAQAAGRIDRVFCASLADVFEDWIGPIVNAQGAVLAHCDGVFQPSRLPGFGDWPLATLDDVRRDLFKLIDATPNLFWLLLTKRPENVRDMWPMVRVPHPDGYAHSYSGRPYRPNVGIGTSISDQRTTDELVPDLLACRALAPVLFLSYEPAIGPVPTLYRCLNAHEVDDDGQPICADCGTKTNAIYAHHPITCWKCGGPMQAASRVDWVICGGESGHHARPMHPQWARDVRDQCTAAGVPFFFKQWGEWLPFDRVEELCYPDFSATTPVCLVKPDGRVFRPYSHAEHAPGQQMARVGKHAAGRLLDGREWNELPEKLSAVSDQLSARGEAAR